MTSYEGKTDEVLHIKLPSSFLHAIWLADEIAINGKSYLEVLTHWVGNKAPIKITIKDLQGKVVHVKEDEINNNLYQFLYAPSSTNNTGGVTFEVELPVHKKKTMGNLLRIGKPVEISALRFTDFNSEKTLTEIMERVPVACEAKVKGMPIGAKALISVYLRLNSAAQRGALLVEAEVPVEDGKAILYFDPNINNRIAAIKVQQELNKEYGTYLQPEYYFEVITGGVAAVSGPAKAVQNMTMHFWEMPNVAGTLEGKKVTIVYPDGKKEEKTIPKDGNIEFPKTLPGKHKVVVEEGVKVKSGALHDSGKLAWGMKVSAEFRDKVKIICSDLGIDPNFLMACMAFESGLSPSIQNKFTKATGLIQFMSSTAKSLDTTLDDLKEMPAEKQLDYVHNYFKPYKGKIHSLEDCYMVILWPAAVGKPDDYALFKSGTKAYEQNSGLDTNKDGVVTKFEAAEKVRKKYKQGALCKA